MDALGYIEIEIDKTLFAQIEDSKLHSSAAKKAAESFRINADQVRHMNEVPSDVAESMYFLSESWAEACSKITGDRHWPREKWGDRETYLRIQEAHAAIYPEIKKKSKQYGGMPPLHLLHIEHMDPELKLDSGLEGMARSLIVSSWAAIEALTQDLWVESVNERPHLAMLKGRGKGCTTQDIPDSTIPIGHLLRHNFAVADKMGTILVDSDRIEFGTLTKTKSAYKMAFHIEPDPIMIPLESDEILALCKTRNVLAHNAGKMNEEFRSVAKSLSLISPLTQNPNDKSPLKDNEMIHFDGSLVRVVVNGAFNRACQLIVSVDDWLKSHPA